MTFYNEIDPFAAQKFQHQLGNYVFKLQLTMEKQKRERGERKRLQRVLRKRL